MCSGLYGTKDTRLTTPPQAVSPTPGLSRAWQPQRGTSGGCQASAAGPCWAQGRAPDSAFAPLARSLLRWRGASPPRLQAETETVLAHHLDVRRRHHGVLDGDVHVAEAAFEAAARIDRGRPGGVAHQVHGLCRTLGRVGTRQADARPEIIVKCFGIGRVVGQRAHGLIEERAAGT